MEDDLFLERVPFDVIPFDDSLFCVIWSGYDNISGIYGQFVSHSARRIGNNFMISDFPDQDYWILGGFGDYNESTGLFVSVWSDNRDSTGRIFGRVFDSNATFMGPSVQFSDESITNDTWDSYAFWNSDTTVLVFYQVSDEENLYFQHFSIDGESIGLPRRINELNGDVSLISVSRDDDGRMIVIWSNRDSEQIHAQRIDKDLSFVGSNFKVTTGSYYLIYSSKVILRNGIVYVTWTDYPYKTYINVFDYDDPPVGIDAKQAAVPRDFTLYQNYPNPFNASTKIKYSVPVESNVAISVYDICGNQVEILDSGLHNSGQYELVWNAQHLTSGIYFIELAAGNCRLVKKCLIVK